MQSVIQSDIIVASGAGTTLAVAFGVATQAGNSVVACVACTDTQTVTGVAGTQCGAMTQAFSFDDSVQTGKRLDQWYAQASPGGSETITATYSASVTNRVLHIFEVNAMEIAVSPVDKTASLAGSGAAITTGAVTPDDPGGLFIGFCISSFAGGVAQSPFTQGELENSISSASEFYVQDAAAPQGATMNQGGAAGWGCILVVYKVTSSAGPTGPYLQVSGWQAAHRSQAPQIMRT